MDAEMTQPERGWGNYIRIESEPFYVGKEKIIVEMIYAHLNSLKVRVGDYVNQGDFIAYPDNTGLLTTGDHLHFGVKIRYWRNGDFLADENGYGGWIDPDELFEDKGWNLLPVQKRYERADCWRKEDPKWRPWHAYLSEVRIVGVLRGKLKRLPNNMEVSAACYGAWDFEAIRNPAMFPIWAEMTKQDWSSGKKTELQLGLNSSFFGS
jgi:murein DD-endopeptidase MepM/ murein hydrolase activator NlpD